MFPMLAGQREIKDKVEQARVLRLSASDRGYMGRARKFADATILAMQRGDCNDDERIVDVVIHAMVQNGIVPVPEDMLRAFVEMDLAVRNAAALLSAGATQEAKEFRLSQG